MAHTGADPISNIVLFALGPDREPVGTQVPAQAEDGLERAWRQVVREHRVIASQVTEIHSMWATSRPDQQYAARTFPNAALTAVLPRPEADSWDEAVASAERLMNTAADMVEEEELSQTGLVESETDAAVLPVLRSASLPDSDFYQQRMPHFFLVPGYIYVTFARMAWTPRNTIGMHHVLHDQVTDPAVELETVFTEALSSVTDGLRAELRGSDDGEELIVVRREDGLPASPALCLPDFHEWISGTRGWQELVVALFCPDELMIAPAGSACEELLRREVPEAEMQAPELLPSLLRVTAEGMELLLEGRHPAG